MIYFQCRIILFIMAKFIEVQGKILTIASTIRVTLFVSFNYKFIVKLLATNDSLVLICMAWSEFLLLLRLRCIKIALC